MNKWGEEIKPNKPWSGMGRFTVKKFWAAVGQPQAAKSDSSRRVKECLWCGFKKSAPGICPECNRSGGQWSRKRAESLYGSPCILCHDINVFRTYRDDPCVCPSCRQRLELAFKERELNRKSRIGLCALRKQMAEVGQLIRTARNLINENHESTPRHSV